MSVVDNFNVYAIPKKPSLKDKLIGISTNAEMAKYHDMVQRQEIAKYGDYQNTRSSRPGIPSFDFSPSYTNRLWLSMCYWYEDQVSILSDVLQKMRDEIVRYGFRWKPAFAKKCDTCGAEYENVVGECEVCGSEHLHKPDKAQLRLARIDNNYTFIEKANLNDQTLQDVIKQTLFHMLNTDNGYVFSHKEYHWDENGFPVSSFPREFLALDPRDVIKLFDFETGYPGKGRVCLDHRSSLLGEKDTRCPICGKLTQRAFYQVFTATKSSTYYVKDEIFHFIHYYPGMVYGSPKCLKIKDMLVAYHMIDKRVRNYYEYCKVPGILFIPSENPEGVREMWLKTREETSSDPFTPAVIGISDGAPTQANFIKFMEDPNQNLIAVKDDLRDRIASAYGVTMAFTNDTSQTGGVKNDKNLISLADRTIRSLQETIDNKILKRMTISMGITDWILECEPNINDNKLEEEEVISAKLKNMAEFNQLGIKTEWKGDTYIISEQSSKTGGTGVEVQAQDPNMPQMPNNAPPSMPGVGNPQMPQSQPQMPMAQPQAEPEPQIQTFDVTSGNFFADGALGQDISSKKGRKAVKSELFYILDELFYPEKVAEQKKQEEEAQAQQEQMAQQQMMNQAQNNLSE